MSLKKPKPLNALKLSHSSQWFKFANESGQRLKKQSPWLARENPGRWLDIADAGGDEATVKIYGVITPFAFWEDEVSAAQIYDEIQGITADTIHVRLNSDGGSVFDGVAIYNLFREHSSKVVVHIDGSALSIAGVIAMAGDEIIISEGATFMAHDPWTWTAGNAEELRKEAEVLDTLKGGIVNILARRSGKNKEEVAELMANETWHTGEEAVEAGFADRVAEEEPNALRTNGPKNQVPEPPVEPEPEPEPAPEPSTKENSARLSILRRRTELNERLANDQKTDQ